MRYRGLAGAALIGVLAFAWAAPAQDWALDPSFGGGSLALGSGGSLEVEVAAGGDLDLSDLIGGACVGRVASAPEYRVTAEPGAGGALRFRVRSEIDSTLLVRGPDGAYFCDDDGGGLFDALVVVSPAAPGPYHVWVGAYGLPQVGEPATLAIDAPAGEEPAVRTRPASPTHVARGPAAGAAGEDAGELPELSDLLPLQPPGGDGPYFFAEDGRPVGPVPLSGIVAAIAGGRVAQGTLVWHPAMADWAPAETIPDLAHLLAGGDARTEALMAGCRQMAQRMSDRLAPEECGCIVAELETSGLDAAALDRFVADFAGAADALFQARDPIVQEIDRLCF